MASPNDGSDPTWWMQQQPQAQAPAAKQDGSDPTWWMGQQPQQQQQQRAPAPKPMQRTLNPLEVDWSDPLGMNGPPAPKPAPLPVGFRGTTDPNTGQPVDPRVDKGQYANLTPWEKVQHGISDPAHPNLWNAVYGMTGAYDQSVTGGLMMEPTRMAMEASGYGMDKLRTLYPGQTDDWYKQKLHGFYNDAVTSSRQQAQQQAADNPYPLHQIPNTAASVLGSADPTWLLAPGASTVGRQTLGQVAKTVATRGAAMGGLGAVSDAAAQVMDLAEGQQKDFDIDRNLKAAAFSGLFGAGHATVTEVPSFVKGLFSTRGVDTTPNVDPRADTHAPTTGDSPVMNPAEQAHLKELLRTGSVDDIKSFLSTKQGPKPTFQDVNKLVETRDSVPTGRPVTDLDLSGQGVPDATPHPDFTNLRSALDGHIADTQRQVVQDHIDALTSGWAKKPDVEVVPTPDHIADPKIREQVKSQDTDPNNQALGMYGSDGKVRIFSDRANTPELVSSAIYHEGLAHFGLDQQFGTKLQSTMTTLADRNVGQFGKAVIKKMRENPTMSKALAAEETMANMSQKGPLKPVLKDAIVSNLRQFGRKMGLNLGYSDAEVQHILAMTHDAVINGKARDVALNGFKGTKPVSGAAPNSKWLNMSGETDAEPKFMFTGEKAANFDPNHPTAFTAEDGQARNEIGDRNAEVSPVLSKVPPKGFMDQHSLGDVLNHPRLFKEYPELKDMKVNVTDLSDRHLDAAYDPITRSIYVDPSITDHKSAVLHEVQHAIQHIEDRSRINTDSTEELSREDHDAHPLEKEAIATEDRLNMTPQERADNPVSFMKRSDMAQSDDFVPRHIESIYDALDKQYVPTYKSQAETMRDAGTLGFSPSQIKDLGKTPEAAVRVERMRASINSMQIRLGEIQDKVDKGLQTPQDEDKALQIIADQMTIGAKLRDERAEYARALAISKLGYTRSQMESYAELLKEHGGTLAPLADRDNLVKFLKQLNQMKKSGNLSGAGSMINSLSKPNWEDYLTTLHQNMMLSGVSTHVKAPLDMMIGIGNELKDSGVALIHSGGVAALNAMGAKLQPGVHPTEVAARLMGVIHAAFDGITYHNTAKTFVEGGVNPNNFGGKESARIPIVSKVTDLISAQDAFFRAFATNLHLRGLATRNALADARKFGTPTDWDTIMTKGYSDAMNPTKELLKEAKDAADVTLLLNRNALTEPLDRWKRTDADSSGIVRARAFVLNFLTPFIRVESNSLITRVIRRSPLALFDPQTIRQLKAGGPEAGMAMARIVMGTATIASAWAAAGQKKTTGNGPDNPAKRAELMAGGWQPNAVHEDGQYNTGNKLAQSLNPFDPHNATYSMVAGLRESYEKGANKGQVGQGLKLALMTSFKELGDMSWVNDMSPAIDTFLSGDAGESKWSKFLSGEARTLVPNLVGQAARITDQSQPHTAVPGSIGQSVLNTMAAEVPGLRETLPVRHDVYGNPVQSGTSLAGQHTWMPQDNRITGGNHVDETHDPAEQELQRLTSLIPGALVTAVQHTVTVNGEKKALTVREFESYQQLAGRAIVETVRQEMGTPQWKAMTDQEKVMEVKDIQKDMKKAAKEQLFGTP